MKNNKKYIKRELIIPLNSGQLVTESLLTEVINKLFANEIKEVFSIKGDSGYIASFFASVSNKEAMVVLLVLVQW